jgi:hypothetical protein
MSEMIGCEMAKTVPMPCAFVNCYSGRVSCSFELESGVTCHEPGSRRIAEREEEGKREAIALGDVPLRS